MLILQIFFAKNCMKNITITYEKINKENIICDHCFENRKATYVKKFNDQVIEKSKWLCEECVEDDKRLDAKIKERVEFVINFIKAFTTKPVSLDDKLFMAEMKGLHANYD